MSISEEPDFSQFDDSALISLRQEMRSELERLPPHSVLALARTTRRRLLRSTC